MVSQSRIEPIIPAADLSRARAFYAEKLGLTPVSEVEGYLRYRTDGGTAFTIYETEHSGTAGHTLAGWHVPDLEPAVRDLQAKGVTFEVYEDLPGVEWDGEIATIPGMGHCAWFRDSEGNILAIDDEPA